MLFETNKTLYKDCIEYSKLDKPFRQLVCFTYLSCGSCSYYNKCQYLHPNNLKNKVKSNTKYKKNNKENYHLDLLFFPQMPKSIVNLTIDEHNKPLITQDYIVPHFGYAPYTGEFLNINKMTITQNHAKAIYSLWNYFIDFMTNKSNIDNNENIEINKYTFTKRLKIFIDLSECKNISN